MVGCCGGAACVVAARACTVIFFFSMGGRVLCEEMGLGSRLNCR